MRKHKLYFEYDTIGTWKRNCNVFLKKRILVWKVSTGSGANGPNKTSRRPVVEETTKMSSDLRLFLSNVNVSVAQTMEIDKVCPTDTAVVNLTMCQWWKWTFGINSDYFLSREANVPQTKYPPKLTSTREFLFNTLTVLCVSLMVYCDVVSRNGMVLVRL